MLRGGKRTVSDLDPVSVDSLVGSPGLDQRRRQVVHAPVGVVAYDQLPARVEHTKAMRHVVEGDVEPAVDLFKLNGLRHELYGVFLEDRHSARHCTDFVTVIA